MPNFCSNCGKSISDNIKFCPECGVKTLVSSDEIQSPISQTPSVQQSTISSAYIPPVTGKKESALAQTSTTETTTKKRSTGEWVAICCGGIILLVIVAFVFSSFMTGFNSGISKSTPTTVSSRGGDQAAVAKMSEMSNWMQPTIQVIGESATSHDVLKMGVNSALLRTYIDQNLPEMKQLAASTTTKKAAAQEYVAFLEDLRTAADLGVQAADKHNSGDLNGSADLMLEASTYVDKAAAHMQQSTALLK